MSKRSLSATSNQGPVDKYQHRTGGLIYGKEVLNKLGVSLIAPQDVILTPDLLLKK